jgi:hypothetical protein
MSALTNQEKCMKKVWLFCLTASLPLACKKQPQNSVQSIDTTLQDELIKNRVNNCGPDEATANRGAFAAKYSRTLGIEASGAVSEAFVRSKLVSIPDLLVDNLANAGGKIIVRVGAGKFCQEKYDELSGSLPFLSPPQIKSRAADLRGCWWADRESAASIYIEASADAVNDSLLPLMTYLYVERLDPQLVSMALKEKRITQDEHATFTKADDELSELRLQVVNSFFADLKRQGREDVAKRYENDFGVKVGELTLTNTRALGNLILAESVDSYYCSKDTFNYFSAEGTANPPFQDTYTIFQKVASNLGTAWHQQL